MVLPTPKKEDSTDTDASKSEMSSASIKVQVSADTTEIAAMRRNMSSYRTPLLEGVQYLRGAFGTNFDSQGSMVGGWDPLKPATSKWRAEQGLPPFGPMLVNNGSLRAAVLAAQGDVGSHSAELSIKHELVGYHQYGTRNMVSRKILFEPAGFAQLMARRIRAHIVPNTFTADLRALFS